MKVFISYGDADDQVTALRLQALAAVNGLTVYVPPAHTRSGQQKHLNPEAALKLKEADVVLGVISNGFTEACNLELGLAKASKKTTIVMCDPHFAAKLQPFFKQNLVVVDPSGRGKAEEQIVKYLDQVKAKKNARVAVLALGALALGLLIFASD